MSKRLDLLVTLDGAGVVCNGRWLLRGVTCTVEPGEIVTLFILNGSHKSTTAKMALGIVKPDEGTATRPAGVKITCLPQSLAIDWKLPLAVECFLRLADAVDIGQAGECRVIQVLGDHRLSTGAHDADHSHQSGSV